MEIDYNKSLFLQYTVNQTLYNHTNPFKHVLIHDIQVNISFSATADWIVVSKYDWTYMLFFNNWQQMKNYDEFRYKFYNSSKYIYEAVESDNGFDINSTYSYISSRTNLSLGESALFRVDSKIFINEIPVNNTNMTYSGNQDISVMNNNYTTNVFEGNITEFLTCN